MERYPCRWWLLPGNHDYALNGRVWDRVRPRRTANVVIVTEPDPQKIENGVWPLPAPLTLRHHPDDPTIYCVTMVTTEARLRIGLAHGSIRGFGSRGETNNQIPPDRPEHSDRNYLALGICTASSRLATVLGMLKRPKPTASSATFPGMSCSNFGGGEGVPSYPNPNRPLLVADPRIAGQ